MWEELYEDYFKELVSYGTRMCGSRELSEDLAQETFIKAMMHAAAIEDLSPPQAEGMVVPYFQKPLLRPLSADHSGKQLHKQSFV